MVSWRILRFKFLTMRGKRNLFYKGGWCTATLIISRNGNIDMKGGLRMRLKDKVVIVTGAASGFGEGIARHFAEQGASIIVADISDKQGEAVANSLPSANSGW